MNGVVLKRCPFCGGKADVKTFVYVNYHSFVVCEKCGARTNEYQSVRLVKSEQEVIKAWNTRTPVEEVLARLEEVSFVDIDEAYADDGQRMVFLHDAIEIIKEVFNE